MVSMKISVVVPVYNEQKYIGQCLQALTTQTRPPDEIIVVNNNSTDESETIIKKYKVRLINEKKQGMTYARNRGFNEATGDIIARTDSDSVPPPDWIEKIEKNFKKNSLDGLGGPLDMHDLQMSSPGMSGAFITIIRFILGGKGVMLGPNMVLTKKIWEKIKDSVCMDNHKVHEDIDLSIHVNKAGGIIGYDETLIMRSSGRRIRDNPLSFFLEYPMRLISTFRTNHHS
jgi:glycosyltransferase involved in cell wall biosynthesis